MNKILQVFHLQDFQTNS